MAKKQIIKKLIRGTTKTGKRVGKAGSTARKVGKGVIVLSDGRRVSLRQLRKIMIVIKGRFGKAVRRKKRYLKAADNTILGRRASGGGIMRNPKTGKPLINKKTGGFIRHPKVKASIRRTAARKVVKHTGESLAKFATTFALGGLVVGGVVAIAEGSMLEGAKAAKLVTKEDFRDFTRSRAKTALRKSIQSRKGLGGRTFRDLTVKQRRDINREVKRQMKKAERNIVSFSNKEFRKAERQRLERRASRRRKKHLKGRV
jgi:hypothetical protein